MEVDKKHIEFLLESIFENIKQGSRLTKADQTIGDLAYVMSGNVNQGIENYISNDVTVYPKNSITIDILGNVFYRNYDFGASDDVGVYWSENNNYSKEVMLYLTTTLKRYFNNRFDYGNKIRSVDTKKIKIELPIDDTGALDYNYMEEIINNIFDPIVDNIVNNGRRKLSELDFLTKDETNKTVGYKEFKISEFFTIKKTNGSYNVGDLIKTNEAKYPYVTRTSENNGIHSYTEKLASEPNEANCISLGLMQMNFFYRETEWYAGQFIRKLIPNEPMGVYTVLWFISSLNRLSETFQSVLIRDIDDFLSDYLIEIPVDSENRPNFEIMEDTIINYYRTMVQSVNHSIQK